MNNFETATYVFRESHTNFARLKSDNLILHRHMRLNKCKIMLLQRCVFTVPDRLRWTHRPYISMLVECSSPPPSDRNASCSIKCRPLGRMYLVWKREKNNYGVVDQCSFSVSLSFLTCLSSLIVSVLPSLDVQYYPTVIKNP